MNKNTRKITSLVLGIVTVSSIALALHFYSNFQEVRQSHEKLNEQYKTVLLENEDLRDSNIQLHDEATKVSGLLEQSEMEIERLKQENEDLQSQVKALQTKVVTLEKK